MTGMHAVHMIIGVGLISVILFFAVRGRYGPEYHNPVEISGLYWHFVDIIWIFLFPLLYLLRQAPRAWRVEQGFFICTEGSDRLSIPHI